MYILIIGLLTDGGRGPVGPGPAPLDPLPYLGAEEVAPLPIQGGWVSPLSIHFTISIIQEGIGSH